MPQNEFKPFAIASNAAVLEQSEYETSQALREGFKKGLARSVEVNKAIRQASSIATAIAEFTAEKSGKDMLDNGEVGILKENFETALSAVSSLLIADAQGTSDALSASFTPTFGKLKNGTLVHVRAKEKNRTKTPLFKADETREKVIVKGNNLSLEEGISPERGIGWSYNTMKLWTNGFCRIRPKALRRPAVYRLAPLNICDGNASGRLSEGRRCGCRQGNISGTVCRHWNNVRRRRWIDHLQPARPDRPVCAGESYAGAKD